MCYSVFVEGELIMHGRRANRVVKTVHHFAEAKNLQSINPTKYFDQDIEH
jgi:hypothetical protein